MGDQASSPSQIIALPKGGGAQHGLGEKFSLEQVKDAWQLTTPVKVEAEQAAVNKLAGDLGRMEAVDFIANEAKKEDLDKAYGLAKPALSATVSFTTKDKKPQTLEVGKQRGDKPEFFAKLDSSPAVFVVKKELHDALDQNSLRRFQIP